MQQVHVIVRLVIAAGKVFFVVSLKKPLPNKILSHFTNMTISMDSLIHVLCNILQR